MSTTEDVVRILKDDGGYKELPKPLRVGSQAFDFTHALVAGDRANDLVVVIEVRSDGHDEDLIRRVLGLTRALDVLQSKRPVTAVLTSGQTTHETLRTLSEVCRVLPIGTQIGKDADQAVRDWLSVLLPLEGPSSAEAVLVWEPDLAKALEGQEDQELVTKLIEASHIGTEAVELAFATSIRTAVVPVLDEESAA
jgi:hypothetical protein